MVVVVNKAKDTKMPENFTYDKDDIPVYETFADLLNEFGMGRAAKAPSIPTTGGGRPLQTGIQNGPVSVPTTLPSPIPEKVRLDPSVNEIRNDNETDPLRPLSPQVASIDPLGDDIGTDDQFGLIDTFANTNNADNRILPPAQKGQGLIGQLLKQILGGFDGTGPNANPNVVSPANVAPPITPTSITR
jgi:hypothetical protein